MKSLLCLTLFLLIVSPSPAQGDNDYPFDVKRSGFGEKAIIFVPGLACSGEVWAETLSLYERDYSCHVLTMAGFAGVAPNSEPDFENWKSSIVRYIKAKDIQKPILIGHSMGGGLAMAVAADYPDLVDKIVVVDALPSLRALTDPRFRPQENVDCSAIVDRIISISEEDFYEMQKKTIAQLLQNADMLETVIHWSLTSDRKTFAKMFCDFSNIDLRERIKEVKCPTLVLLEPYFKNLRPAVEQQFENLEGAQLKYANKGLHFIMYDDKEWYFAQLANFIRNR